MKALFFLMFSLIFLSCTKDDDQKKLKLTSDKEKALYAMGSKIAKRLKNFEISKEEFKFIAYGLRSSLFEKSDEEKESFMPLLDNFVRERNLSEAEKNKKKGEEYAKIMLEKGFEKTKSGLLYKINRPGNENRAAIVDSVMINYEGSSVQGEVFESSYEDGEKLTIPITATIRGWREALKMIGERGEIEIITPAHLAYGDEGSYPRVPPGASLRFKIELYKIEKLELPQKKL